jgi:bisanhydrobacterioruberin hydratase
MNFIKQHKVSVAVAIAILFHCVGLFGILFFDQQLFASLTPMNLLLCYALLVWTQQERNVYFWLFVIICFVVGFFAEYAGVNHQLLFGEYKYLSALGQGWKGVPFIIGINWFIIIYCSGVTVQLGLNYVWNRLKNEDQQYRFNVGFFAVILDGSLLATFFDWVMEPVAVKLGFWQWLGNGEIPLKNYISWFAVSLLLLLCFRLLKFQKLNQFAVHLLIIQLLFFLILRSVL